MAPAVDAVFLSEDTGAFEPMLSPRRRLRMELEQLPLALTDARRRTLELVSDLADAQLLGPKLSIVNPLRWELGHVARFHEKWILRHVLGRAPMRVDGDALYDSAAVPHASRWRLPLPSRAEIGTHKVLRGGCWMTRSRLIRNTWRNFYTPDRRDLWAGFRTCAV